MAIISGRNDCLLNNCLRIKKNYGRKSISNPTSPVAQPRRAISSPEELAGQDDEASSIYAGGALKADDLSHYSQVSGKQMNIFA